MAGEGGGISAVEALRFREGLRLGGRDEMEDARDEIAVAELVRESEVEGGEANA